MRLRQVYRVNLCNTSSVGTNDWGYVRTSYAEGSCQVQRGRVVHGFPKGEFLSRIPGELFQNRAEIRAGIVRESCRVFAKSREVRSSGVYRTR